MDAELKLTGTAEYAGDAEFVRLLHGRPVLSPYAHARIVGIDTSAALALPGVHAVLRASDLPIVGTGGRAAEPLAASEVVFAGQPVALVVASSEAIAADAAELVIIDYDPLDPVLSLEDAVAPGSALARVDEAEDHADIEMHGAVGKSAVTSREEPYSTNVVGQTVFEHGDLEAAFAECAAVAEGRFRTAWVHQAYMEPQVATAWPSGAGGVKLFSSTQSVFFVRDQLSRVLGIPISQIEVEAGAIGGGFGGKIGLLDPLVAAAALAVRRPLRVAFTRSEDFAAANPAPAMLIDLRVGARADGTLAALESRVLVDNGAFTDASPAPLAAGRVGGPYRWDSWSVRTLGVRTNRPGAGAYRGPTATQTAFALETLVEELAVQLGLDSLELRLRNAPHPGDTRLDGTTWPRFGLREVLETAQEHPLWQRRRELPPDEGIGIATGLFPGGRMGAAATIRMDADGGFTIVTGYADVTGTSTSMQSIAGGVLGVDPGMIRVAAADSSVSPQSGVSGGSMVTYCLGSAVLAAADDARNQLFNIAARELEVDPASCEITNGEIASPDAGGKSLSLADLGRRLTGFGGGHAPVEGHGTALPPELAPSAAAAIVHLAVDRDTGEVRIHEFVAIQDVGRAINPSLCEGQMRGGAAQSIGFALFEELAHDAQGQIISGSFLNYTLPNMETVPPVETVLVEVPSPYGPFGARGIGESAIVPGAAAIANAIGVATGARPQELPITPPRLWRALEAARTAVPSSSRV
jgi:CO/xanthine dehydrogenase Mo-binding subunit